MPSQSDDGINVLVYSLCTSIPVPPFVVVGLDEIKTIELLGARDKSFVPGGHVFWRDIFDGVMTSWADHHSRFTPSIQTINGLFDCHFRTLPLTHFAQELDVSNVTWGRLFREMMIDQACFPLGIFRLIPNHNRSRYMMTLPDSHTPYSSCHVY